MTCQRLRFLQFFNSGVVGFMSGVTLAEAGTTFIFGFNERKEQKCRTNWGFTGRALVARLVILSPASIVLINVGDQDTHIYIFMSKILTHFIFCKIHMHCTLHSCFYEQQADSHWPVMCSCTTKCSRRQDFQALVCVNGCLSWSRRRQYMKYLPPVCLWTHEWISVNCFERAKLKRKNILKIFSIFHEKLHLRPLYQSTLYIKLFIDEGACFQWENGMSRFINRKSICQEQCL